jgi:hypothetical protein
MPIQSVPQYGLLSGLANGLNEGLLSYQNQKNIQRNQQLQSLATGVQENPDTGKLEYTPEKQQEIQTKTLIAKNQADELDPTSQQSQTARTTVKGILESQKKGSGAAINDDMSAAEAKSFLPLFKSDVSGQYVLMGHEMMNQAALDRMQGTIGQRQQRNQMSANQQYSKEMGPTENQLLSANRVNALVSGINAGQLQSTPQLKSDLSAALAQMLNAGKPATVYGMSHQEFDSVYGRAQRAYQFLSGSTGNSMTDAQLQQLQKDVGALADEYQKQREVKYNSFKQGLPSEVTPGLDQRYQSFTQGVASPQSQKGLIGTTPTKAPKAGQIIDGYKFLGGDPAKSSNWEKQ